MEAYSVLSEVYDVFMDNVPYEKWGDFIENILKGENINDGLLLDLGCGTGKMTRILQNKGYDMTGADNSFEMLDVARQDNENGEILYLCQDMRGFELYGTMRAIVCVCDCVNYILDENELLTVFKLVNNYLDPKGLFVFDFNTDYKYRNIGDGIIAENREEGSFIWENDYDKETRINEYDLTIYLRCEDEELSDLYERYEEVHYQRGYTLTEIKEIIEKSGLEFVAAYDDYENKEISESSERITIVAREHGKEV